MTTTMNRIFFATCLIIFITITPAYAVEINDEGAKRLKNILTTQIEFRKNTFKQIGGDLIIDGQITIEQGKDYYAATIPATTVKMATGEKTKIGLIAINAIPTENPENWKMSIAIPTPILITNNEDKTIQRIDIGKQNMGGIWSSSLAGFSKLSAQYSDIKLTDLEKNNSLTIDKIIIKSDLEEKEKKLWDGSTTISLSNLSVASSTINNLFSIDELTTIISLNEYLPYKKGELLKKIKEDGANKVLLNLLRSSGDVSAQFNLKNLKINEENPNNKISGIDLIQISYSSDAPKDNKINQGLKLAYQGLKFKDNEETNNLIPTEFKTSINIEKFPLIDAMNLVENTINENKNSNARQVAAMKALNFLPEKFKAAETTLSLKNTNFNNKIYDVKVDGNIKADPNTQIGGIGNLNIEITGLDYIMKELQSIPNGSNLMQQLTIFRMISDQKGNKNTAHLELNKQGSITVNGKDISALMGGEAE